MINNCIADKKTAQTRSTRYICMQIYFYDYMESEKTLKICILAITIFFPFKSPETAFFAFKLLSDSENIVDKHSNDTEYDFKMLAALTVGRSCDSH